MIYRKGEVTKKQKLRDWPHHVRMLIPEMGLGQRLNAMHDFCRAAGFDFTEVSDCQPGQPDAMIWCFRDEADAERFRSQFPE